MFVSMPVVLMIARNSIVSIYRFIHWEETSGLILRISQLVLLLTILQLNSFLFTSASESQQESVCDQHGLPVSILEMTKQLQKHLRISSCPTSKQGCWLPDSDNGMVTPFTWKWDYSQGCRNSLIFNIPSDSQNILIAYWETIGKFPYVWYFLDNAMKEKIAPQVLPVCALLLISLAYYRLKDNEGLLWVRVVQEGDCTQLSLIFSVLN